MTHDDGSSQPATKGDVSALRSEMHGSRDDLRMDMTDLRTDMTELRTEMTEMRTEIRGDIRALGVAVEQTNKNVQLLAEAIGGVRTELKADLAALEERLSVRIGRLEDAVRVHSSLIKDLSDGAQKTGRAMLELRGEVAALRHDFERRDAERLTAIEARVTVLEKRTGIV